MVSTAVGKYSLVRRLAAGGMAEVYLATPDPGLGLAKHVVIKRILPHLAEDAQFVEMFLNEAKVAAQLNHPNVVSIFDLGQAGDSFFIAMELIDGPNLRTLTRRAFDAGHPLDPCLAAKVISLACAGLQYAHDAIGIDGHPLNLIHRDISPDNILVSRQGMVKVVDFGIAKATNQGAAHTKTGVLKGKLAYMAPEQIKGEAIDRRADVFALGVVLYELLAGTKPFDATSEVSTMQAILNDAPDPLLEVRPDAGEEMAEIVDGCLQKDRNRRYPDCATLKADLDEFMANQRRNITADDLAKMVEALMGPAVPIEQTPPTKSRPGTGPGSGSRPRPKTGSSQPGRPASSPGVKAVTKSAGGPVTKSRPGPVTEPRPSLEVLDSQQPGPRVTAEVRLAGGEKSLEEHLMEDEPTHIGNESSPELAAFRNSAGAGPIGRRKSTGAGSWAVPGILVGLAAVGIAGALALHLSTPAASGAAASATRDPAPTPAVTGPSAAPAPPPAATAQATAPSTASPATPAPASPTPTAVAVVSPPPTPEPAPSRAETRSNASRRHAEAREEALHRKHETPEVASTSMSVPQVPPPVETHAPSSPGTLKIHVLPWATISIDGRPYGTTPLSPVSLDPGHHTVILDNADLKVHKEVDVDVPSGGEQVLKMRLDQ